MLLGAKMLSVSTKRAVNELRGKSSALSPAPIISVPAAEAVGRGAIYLDYAATTPPDPAVVGAMVDFLESDRSFGNSASITHAYGQVASETVQWARREVASLLSAEPGEIVWTSGATEAINLALKGVALARRSRGDHIVTSALEHKAVLDTTAWLERRGFAISHVELDAAGAITAENLAKALRPNTILVSLMHVNNETGAVTDIAALEPLIRGHGALLHVDAVQSVARLPIEHIAAADLISVSAHKMYGPKGIGALRVRRCIRAELVPQIHGGGHEFGLRSGTLPTHQIVGMGCAAKLVRQHRVADAKHSHALDLRLRTHLGRIEGVEINGDPNNHVPGILNVSFVGVEAESLMLALDIVAISSGSACTSSDIEPSHVLAALGYDADRALSSVRFSFGRFTTLDEIDRTGQLVQDTVTALRRIA